MTKPEAIESHHTYPTDLETGTPTFPPPPPPPDPPPPPPPPSPQPIPAGSSASPQPGTPVGATCKLGVHGHGHGEHATTPHVVLCGVLRYTALGGREVFAHLGQRFECAVAPNAGIEVVPDPSDKRRKLKIKGTVSGPAQRALTISWPHGWDGDGQAIDPLPGTPVRLLVIALGLDGEVVVTELDVTDPTPL